MRSTVSPAKPITARQVERTIKAFETGFVAITDLCRPIAPESVGLGFAGVDREDLRICLSYGGPEYAAQPLDALANAGGRGHDDGEARVRHVYPLIQRPASYQDIDLTSPEPPQVVLPNVRPNPAVICSGPMAPLR